MKFEIISKEKNVATVKLTIEKDEFEKGVEKAYNKNKNRFVVDGFRKGKVPRSIIERKYGKDVFYEDGLDEAFPEVYRKLLEESALEPVASPRLTAIDSLDENGSVITLELALEPEFELGQYKGVEVKNLKYVPNDADVDAEIERLRTRNATTVEDGISANGDTVVIDFEGSIDGVTFEGGKGEGYPLELGSNTFIPGFEEQLVGKQAGDEVEVNVTFPDDYQSTDLAGKPAVFKCKVNSVKHKELPELNDDFAVDIGYDDLSSMREKLAESVAASKQNEFKTGAQNTIMSKIIYNTQIDIPQAMLDEKCEDIRKDNEEQLRKNGLDPQMYYDYVFSGEDQAEKVDKFYRSQAERQIKGECILKKIIEVENIELTDEEFDAEAEVYAKAYNHTLEEFKAEMNDYVEDYIRNSALVTKVYEFLYDTAVEEKKEEE